MIFWQIRTGGDRNFGYLIGDEESKQAAVIDPSYAPKKFLDIASQLRLKIVWVIGTHAHSDHTKGMHAIKKATGATKVKHKSARGARPDRETWDGDRLVLGKLYLEIIHTPGHTPCSICVRVVDTAFRSEEKDKLITGDTLFVGKVGGTRTEGMALKQWNSLFHLVHLVSDNTEIYPGHDFGIAPSSTMWLERRTNPFLLLYDFNDFRQLKDNWEEYKEEHGIE